MKKLIAILITFITFATSAFANNHAGKLIINKRLEKGFSLRLETDYRREENTLNYRHYDFGIGKKFKDGWSVALRDRLVYKHKKGKWVQSERRPQFQVQKVFNFEPLKIAIRTRQDYRDFKGGEHSWRNRSRIMVKSNKEILKVKPFIGNEFFYDFDADKYNKNWLSAGVDFPKVKKIIKPSIYYKYITELSDDNKWVDDYSMVFKLMVDF